MAENPLSILIDRELSSVEFVRDYIQFHFDGPTITAITDPELIIVGTTYKRESQEFCNMMISCIGKAVATAEVKEGDAIRVNFKNDSMLYISLNPDDYISAEAAWFHGENSTDLWVW